MKIIKRNVILILFFFFIAACVYRPGISTQNIAKAYSKKSLNHISGYKLFRVSADTLLLYFQVDATLLKFASINGKDFCAYFSVSYSLFSDVESEVILDSAKFNFSCLSKGALDNVFSIPISITKFNKGALVVVFKDVNTGISSEILLDIDQDKTSQDVLLTDLNHVPLLQDYMVKGKQYFIRTYPQDLLKFYVKYLNVKYTPAPPVFLTGIKEQEKFKPVKTSVITKGDILSFPEEGIYFFQTDTLAAGGIAIPLFHEDFPDITHINQLIETLRYITSNKEYYKMQNSSDKKRAVDAFWLARAGDFDRAKVLLKEYYGRVILANKFFSSLREGWKTDRGITYIIYGAPDGVFKHVEGEMWVYEERLPHPALKFNFIEKDGDFFTREYKLIRDKDYENTWHLAIHEWRKGRITR